jgi:hypothetical protein
MSGAAAAGAAGATAAVAAAARQRMLEEEEQEMTPYDRDDLEGWEFKILRSTSQKFRHREELLRVLDEEAESGWELVEKFDDTRLRLKRRVECREKDRHAELDPYRIWVGTTPAKQGLIVVAVTVGIIVVVGIIAAIAANS